MTAEDRLRVRFAHQQGAPVEIMVQLECLIDGRWYSARRYDTHIALHIHSAPWDETQNRRVPIVGIGLKEALDLAIDDIKVNRDRYRDACVAGVRRMTDGS
ncbi:MAG: hypothetical protein U0893_25215 [Chloroflexota bacterium]